jgi:hypothetical protein
VNPCCEKTLLDQRNAASGYLQGQKTFAPIGFIRVPGAGQLGSRFGGDPRDWLNWALENSSFEFPTPVVIVFGPGKTQLDAGNSGSSITNWIFATPIESKREGACQPTASSGDQFGAGIHAIRSNGQCLWLPRAGKWALMYPENPAAIGTVFDARDEAWARWLCDQHATYHALSKHDEDIDVPLFVGDDDTTVVELCTASP